MKRYIRRFLRLYEGFVISGAIILFGFIAVVFAVLPAIRSTIDLYADVGVIQKEVDALTGKLALLRSLDEESLRGQLAVLLSVVPQDKSVPTIFETVDGLITKSGVHITDMTIMSPGSIATGSATKSSSNSKVKGLPYLSFSLGVGGSYDQIQEFFGMVNTVRRLFSIENFDLSISKTGETTSRIAMGAYYQQLPTKLGGVEVPIQNLSSTELATFEKLSTYQDFAQSSTAQLTPVTNTEKRDPFMR